MVNEEDNVRIGRPRKGGSSPADDLNNASGLWNAQPFKANKPPAPIPEAPGGCARATPLSNVQRISHGTGTGATTVAGFWIPTVESATAAMTAASLRGWSYGASSSIGGCRRTGHQVNRRQDQQVCMCTLPAGGGDILTGHLQWVCHLLSCSMRRSSQEGFAEGRQLVASIRLGRQLVYGRQLVTNNLLALLLLHARACPVCS